MDQVKGKFTHAIQYKPQKTNSIKKVGNNSLAFVNLEIEHHYHFGDFSLEDF
jgi:hypothetical protein